MDSKTLLKPDVVLNADLDSVFKENQDLYRIYPQPVQAIRFKIQNQLKTKFDLNADNQRALIMTGHQIEFFHPGIISKEILGYMVATQLKGACISVILDHDPHDLIFNGPQIYSNEATERIRTSSFLLNTKSQSKDSLVHKKTWIDFLSQIPDNLQHHYEPSTLNQIRENITILINQLDKYDTISDYITYSRLLGLKKLHIHINPLKISEMVHLQGWREYCDLINDDLDKFISAHNSSLDEYRKLHHIKNHAQPVPNLTQHEVPFWVIVDGKRQKAGLSDIKKSTLYPRAITLSIFLRLFVSDIFIHGTGGARYDQVTNSIIRKFFNVKPSSFLVKTASLQIPLKPDSSLSKFKSVKNLHDWLNRYRFLLFHPEKTADADVELSNQRSQLIKKFHETEGSKKKIHDELEENRINILNHLVDYEDQLFNERDEIKKYSLDHNVLIERTFPYFFYDMQELIENQSYEVVKYTE